MEEGWRRNREERRRPSGPNYTSREVSLRFGDAYRSCLDVSSTTTTRVEEKKGKGEGRKEERASRGRRLSVARSTAATKPPPLLRVGEILSRDLPLHSLFICLPPLSRIGSRDVCR